jgi:hypothetical protein
MRILGREIEHSMRSAFRNVDTYQMAYLDVMARSTDQRIMVATPMVMILTLFCTGGSSWESNRNNNCSNKRVYQFYH